MSNIIDSAAAVAREILDRRDPLGSELRDNAFCAAMLSEAYALGVLAGIVKFSVGRRGSARHRPHADRRGLGRGGTMSTNRQIVFAEREGVAPDAAQRLERLAERVAAHGYRLLVDGTIGEKPAAHDGQVFDAYCSIADVDAGRIVLLCVSESEVADWLRGLIRPVPTDGPRVRP